MNLEIALSYREETDLWGAGFIVGDGHANYYGSCLTVEDGSIEFIGKILSEITQSFPTELIIGISSVYNDKVCSIDKTKPTALQELYVLVEGLPYDWKVTNRISPSTYDLAVLASFHNTGLYEHSIGQRFSAENSGKTCALCKHASAIGAKAYGCELILNKIMKKALDESISAQEAAILSRVDGYKLPNCTCSFFEKQ